MANQPQLALVRPVETKLVFGTEVVCAANCANAVLFAHELPASAPLEFVTQRDSQKSFVILPLLFSDIAFHTAAAVGPLAIGCHFRSPEQIEWQFVFARLAFFSLSFHCSSGNFAGQIFKTIMKSNLAMVKVYQIGFSNATKIASHVIYIY